jgi:hypothetical protein
LLKRAWRGYDQWDMEAVVLSPREHLADDPRWRQAQQERLRDLQRELDAAGAAPGDVLAKLEARAAAWPE